MEGDNLSAEGPSSSFHFNPLPPHGGRHFPRSRMQALRSFQSTPSAWRETLYYDIIPMIYFISIHSLRMEGDKELRRLNNETQISIHSLRMEGDRKAVFRALLLFISIHSLRMEGDLTGKYKCVWHNNFNPLPPHGGRQNIILYLYILSYISIHSLRMEGDQTHDLHTISCDCISIHSLRMEGDLWICVSQVTRWKFQSTPSAWRETRKGVRMAYSALISIHSLRMEGDLTGVMIFVPESHFNPLPPHGGRLLFAMLSHLSVIHFNPLPPHGGRHLVKLIRFWAENISIHSLRMEGDLFAWLRENGYLIFQSTPSAWRETQNWQEMLLH